jgi:DNA replication protein DnaC
MDGEPRPGGDTPACPECRDTGFRIVEAGGASRARPCACRSAADRTGAAALLESARIPSRYRDCDFESFAAGYGADRNQALSLEAARTVARRYAEEYPLSDRGLLFMGPPGVGKTHLAVATLRRLILDKRVPCLFCDVQDLLRQLQGTFDRPSGAAESEILHPVLATEVVLLDDLGGRQFRPWVEETLTHIVTARYNERRATLVTTNYLDDPPEPRTPTLADRIGPRVRSRLYEMCHLVRVEARDFRQAINRADHHAVPDPRRPARGEA